ncbi:hypothetical protein ACQ4LE_005849 [Meloidogyne hapla]
MPDCPTCNRPVYFAERVTSIGKDWHRPCLRCFNQACKKTLSAGGHSEVSKNSHLNSIFLNSSMRASPTAIGAMVHCSDLADMVMVESSHTSSWVELLEVRLQ